MNDQRRGKVVRALVCALITMGMVRAPMEMRAQSTDLGPRFETAIVKPNASNDNRANMRIQAGGRFLATGVTLKMLILNVYRIRDFQVSGGPNWINTDRWDIEAKPEEGSITNMKFADPNAPDPISLRVQSLLRDQFHLKIHRETKELPVYDLVIASGGSKMKLSGDQSPLSLPEGGTAPLPPGVIPRGSIRMSGGNLTGTAAFFASFVSILSEQVGRPVVDKTGLKGMYDFTLEWTPDNTMIPSNNAGAATPSAAPEPSLPSIFTAIQEQLGLRLISSRGPVETIVIDSAEKPPL